eukprot:scaffold94157_cov44-Phaeocystis_antarctica.AAC.2
MLVGPRQWLGAQWAGLPSSWECQAAAARCALRRQRRWQEGATLSMLVDRAHLEDSAQLAAACMGCHGTRYTRGATVRGTPEAVHPRRYTRGGIREYARGTYGTPGAGTCTATYSTALPGGN